MVYIPHDLKPTRGLFYKTALISFFCGLLSLYDSDYVFGINIIVLSVIYFSVGIFIIIFPNKRDQLFGKTVCPACSKKTISIKVKLKLKPFSPHHSSCENCKAKLKLPISSTLAILFSFFIPIIVLIESQSLQVMFSSIWVLIFIYLVYFSKLLKVQLSNT